jgi:hypothetical protein
VTRGGGLRPLALGLVMACSCGPAGRPQPRGERVDETLDLEPLGGYPGSTDAEALAMLDLEVASNDAFARASAAYRAGSFRDAARLFMAAAAPILVARHAFNGEIMAENRRACSTDAQRAWRRAGALDEGRAALGAAAARDTDNAEAIRRLIAGLGP